MDSLGYYEASSMVDARQPFVLRHTFVFQGRSHKLSDAMEATQGWQRVKIRFQAPEGCKGVMLAFQMSGVAGKMWIDDVRLVETEPFEALGVAPLGPSADRIHGLQELAKRTRVKPFTMLKGKDDTYGSERLVFKDTATGATIWKMSWNPGYNRHHYSNMLPLPGDRHRPGRQRGRAMRRGDGEGPAGQKEHEESQSGPSTGQGSNGGEAVRLAHGRVCHLG